MNILFLGDIVGKSGRQVVLDHLAAIKEQHKINVVIANGENAAHGFGINAKIANELYEAGVDVITTGNHIWDQKEIVGYISQTPKLLRPGNYPAHQPGQGHMVAEDARGRKVLVINVACRLFMDFANDPFVYLDDVLKNYTLGANVKAIFVDVHGEATSEKACIAHYLDGRVSAVVGTHTHTPTADHRLLEKGTAFHTDAGMCGDYNSCIGMDKTLAVQRTRQLIPKERLQPAEGEATLCGTIIKTDDTTGLATNVHQIIRGPGLENKN